MSQIVPVCNWRRQKRLGPANREQWKPWKRLQPPFPESLTHYEPAFQTQTPRQSRQRGADPGSSPLERSHEPELSFLPGDVGAQVGLEVPKTLLDKSFSRIGQRPVIQPLGLWVRTCPPPRAAYDARHMCFVLLCFMALIVVARCRLGAVLALFVLACGGLAHSADESVGQWILVTPPDRKSTR